MDPSSAVPRLSEPMEIVEMRLADPMPRRPHQRARSLAIGAPACPLTKVAALAPGRVRFAVDRPDLQGDA